jgi:uncharacterized membrane protein YsdA (DUF1294 family)
MWVAAINVIAFFTYGYDKMISSSERTRVPEIVLLALAFVGGWPLAYVAMRFFHHKISAEKAGFRRAFWLLVLAEIMLFVTYVWPRIESAFVG